MKVWQLLTENRWIQFFSACARDEHGLLPVNSDAPGACCWCALGGIMKCYPDPVEQEGVIAKLCRYLETNQRWPRRQGAFDHDVITDWNDARGQTREEVVRVLRKLRI